MNIFSESFREQPYWLTSVPTAASRPQQQPPAKVDVLIVGGGLTGVTAAHELARNGRSAAVLDSGEPGEGASSRNAGFLGRHSKNSILKMKEKVGLPQAKRFFQDLNSVYTSAHERILREKIDCDFRLTGRFIGALSAKHRDALFREFEARVLHLGEPVTFVDGASGEIDSSRHFGGVVIHDNGALHAAKYYRAMRRRAEQAGAQIHSRTPVHAIEKNATGFTVRTGAGAIRAREVLVATNGYTGDLLPWLKSRLIPINAHMIATEELPEDLLRRLLPHHRTYLDNRRSLNYMQLSPDGKRLLFGGQTSRKVSSLLAVTQRIHAEMCFFFPQLKHVKIDNAWSGRCAATLDLLPRTGVHGGVHFAAGYCFSGNAMGPFLGERVAKRMLGVEQPTTIFEESPPPLVPWPARSESVISALMAYYAWADRPQPVPPTERVAPS